jgi:uncharacterized NAD(P)/FAD-binding protein YdhS
VKPRHVAVVGAGASGALQALHALNEGATRVTLIEREREPGRGTAYGTRQPEHLLNVTAQRMIVYPDDPGRFARWFGARGGEADDYAPRMDFGDYLCAEMDAVRDRVDVVLGEAVDVRPAADGEQVVLRDGRTIDADAVVLALGNLRPATLPGIDPARLGRAYVDDPWYGGLLDGLGDEDQMVLIGTALTAVDAALSLDANGFRGRIFAISRRGLLPRAHLRREPVADSPPPFPDSVVGLLRAVRQRALVIGWREAVHELRAHTTTLWRGAPFAEQRRFVRHLRPWWDVHRHRIAPAVAARIAAMESEGRFAVAAGRIASVEPDGDGAVVRWKPRGRDEIEQVRARRVVNCSGPELDIARAGEPLLGALLAAGRIRPDPCRLGVEVDGESRAIGAGGDPAASLYAIGPITRGAFWETIAVGDIAVQARDVARAILSSSSSRT